MFLELKIDVALLKLKADTVNLYNKISKNYKNAKILTTTNEKSKKPIYVVLTWKIFCIVSWKYVF